ncbi:MAG: thiolase family protein [Angustibacter sp.]
MTLTRPDVLFLDGVRTPFGRSTDRGLYARHRADDLVVNCLRELLRRHPQLPADQIDDVILGATTQVGDQGLNIGRMVALLAGLPASVPGMAVDRLCAGAMTAVTTAAGSIALGASGALLAGGVEHLGRHPMGQNLDPNPRFLTERIVDPSALHMGATAENLHDQFPGITRARAEDYALASQEKYARALAAGQIDPDLVPVATHSPELGWSLATRDEPPRPGSTRTHLAALPTPFRPHGRVTAATSAPLAEGATACLLSSAETARRLGLVAQMRLVSHAYAGVAPEVMGLGPIPATEHSLQRAGLNIHDIGLIEINEAFAVQVLAFLDHFAIDDADARVNPFGGALAVGHPLAASGVRLMIQLARQFAENPQIRYGLTTLCVGLGMGGSIVWENPHHADFRPQKARQ